MEGVQSFLYFLSSRRQLSWWCYAVVAKRLPVSFAPFATMGESFLVSLQELSNQDKTSPCGFHVAGLRVEAAVPKPVVIGSL